MAKKNLFLSAALVCAASLVGCGGNNNSTDEVTPEKQPPVEVISTTLPIADPYVLLYDGTYYAYGTSVGNGFEVYTSDDLETWKRSSALALSEKDSYGDHNFWAPEVYYVEKEKKFYIFYSAEEHICVATSDSPYGPFVQDEQYPLYELNTNSIGVGLSQSFDMIGGYDDRMGGFSNYNNSIAATFNDLFFKPEVTYKGDPDNIRNTLGAVAGNVYNGFHFRYGATREDNTGGLMYAPNRDLMYAGGLGGVSGLGTKAGCGGFFLGNIEGLTDDRNNTTGGYLYAVDYAGTFSIKTRLPSSSYIALQEPLSPFEPAFGGIISDVVLFALRLTSPVAPLFPPAPPAPTTIVYVAPGVTGKLLILTAVPPAPPEPVPPGCSRVRVALPYLFLDAKLVSITSASFKR